MALNGYLRLRIDGADVDTAMGEDCTVSQMGGVDVSTALETVYFKASTAIGIGDGHRSSTTVEQSPAEFWVRIGKSTALLAQALYEHKRIDLSFEIFRNNPQTGVTELQFKYEIDQGRLVLFEMENPNTLDPGTTNSPSIVRLGVSAHTTRWVSETQGNEYEYNWSRSRV